MGAPSDPGRGAVGVIVRKKVYERTKFKGRSDVTG
jgi:hypothetical protein